MGEGAADEAAEFGCRIADEIGAADLWEEAFEPGKAAGLRQPPGNPIDRIETGERLGGGVGIRRLGVVDEEHAAEAADLLHAVGEAGKALEPGRDLFTRQADRAAQGEGRGGVLRVVLPAQRADALKAEGRAGLAVFHLDQRAAFGINAGFDRLPDRNAPHSRLRRKRFGDRRADLVIDADHGGILRPQPGENPRLDLGVMVERAVPVEMVGRDVQQAGGIGIEARRQVDLEGGIFDDIGEALGRRIERQDRCADIAAHGGAPAGRRDEMGRERGRRRLAVGAGDGDDFALAALGAALPAEQLGIADDLDAGCLRAERGPMRLGMGERDARRQDQRGEIAPIGGGEVHRLEAGLARRLAALLGVVPKHGCRAARPQRCRRRQPRQAEAEHRHFLSSK